MRKHRFFLADDLNINQTIELDYNLSHQIARVLRLQNGDEIYLFNNSGSEFTAIIQNITRNTVTITITNISTASNESPCKINLGQVIGKGEKMDLVIQKSVELGVHSITPLYSEHSIIKFAAERISSKIEHWQKVANAASSQCQRNIVPIVHAPQNLATWIEHNTDPLKLLCAPNIHATKLHDLKLDTTISLLIGPEGGFSDAEISFALEHKFLTISLGPRILRTETAGLAAISILQSIAGDM